MFSVASAATACVSDPGHDRALSVSSPEDEYSDELPLVLLRCLFTGGCDGGVLARRREHTGQPRGSAWAGVGAGKDSRKILLALGVGEGDGAVKHCCAGQPIAAVHINHVLHIASVSTCARMPQAAKMPYGSSERRSISCN